MSLDSNSYKQTNFADKILLPIGGSFEEKKVSSTFERRRGGMWVTCPKYRANLTPKLSRSHARAILAQFSSRYDVRG